MIKYLLSQLFSKKPTHASINLASSVYFGNLPFDASEEMIRSALGEISNANANKVVIARNAKGLFMGYAFAELGSPAEVEAAVSKLHGSTLGKQVPRKIHAEAGNVYPDLLQRIGH